jgi:hypothetical protein
MGRSYLIAPIKYESPVMGKEINGCGGSKKSIQKGTGYND